MLRDSTTSMEVGYYEVRHPIIVYREPESNLWTAECQGTSLAALGNTLDEALDALGGIVSQAVQQGATSRLDRRAISVAEAKL